MPRPYPPEFRQRAVELARLHEKPLSKIAEDLGIAESCLRNWMKQDEIDQVSAPGSAPTSGPSWSNCVASCEWPRWRTRSCGGRRRISPRRPCPTQNDLHLHRPGLHGPARVGLLSGHGGVDIGLLRLAGQPSHRQGPRRRLSEQRHRRHLAHEPALLWLSEGPCRAAPLTGWKHRSGSRPEFRYLARPPRMPLRILLQRLDHQDVEEAAGHLDLATSDVTLERQRHEALGATVLAEFPDWMTLRDPNGLTYCITRRNPDTGTL
jgi:hypothetical protein